LIRALIGSIGDWRIITSRRSSLAGFTNAPILIFVFRQELYRARGFGKDDKETNTTTIATPGKQYDTADARTRD